MPKNADVGALEDLAALMGAKGPRRRRHGNGNGFQSPRPQKPESFYVKVKAVCVNGPDGTTVMSVQNHNRFSSPPARCHNCFGSVDVNPTTRVRIGCFWEIIR